MLAGIKFWVLGIYYLFYLTLDRWMNPGFLFSLIGAVILGYGLGKRGKRIPWKGFLCLLLLLLYAGILLASKNGGILESSLVNQLRWLYYGGMFWAALGAGSRIFANSCWIIPKAKEEKEGLWKGLYRGSLLVYGVSLLPLILLSPYVFPKSDDHIFGHFCRRAWEETGSLAEVLKGAWIRIADAYVNWQGTYASIFWMALQPGVFDEHLYGIVPLLFIGILTLSGYVFAKTVLVDWLQTDWRISQVVIWVWLIFVIQRIPDPQSAFIWYNGAVHYLAAHGVMLGVLAGLLRIALGKGRWPTRIGVCLGAVYVGGGNLLTAIGMLLLCLTFLFVVILTRRWKQHLPLLGFCSLYFVALGINMLAPGNGKRQDFYEGYSLLDAFFRAFTTSLDYALGKWLHGTVFLLIFLLLPLLWRIAKSSSFSFPCPLLVLGYSWCYLSALFFVPLYTLGTTEVGRLENIMFIQWTMLLLFNLLYGLGWLQRKYGLENLSFLSERENRYVSVVLGIGLVFLGLSSLAEPRGYTSLYALQTVLDPGLKQYRAEYEAMLLQLKGEEEQVEIRDFSYVPSLLDVPAGLEGVKTFYGKERVVIHPAE